MGGGRSEPEEEREVFFPQIVADADGGEVAGGDLLAHLADGVDHLGGGEGTHPDVGGEETEVRGLHGEAHRGDGTNPPVDRLHRPQTLQDAGARLFLSGVVIEFDTLSVLVAMGGDGAENLVGRHAYIIRMRLRKRFGPHGTGDKRRRKGFSDLMVNGSQRFGNGKTMHAPYISNDIQVLMLMKAVVTGGAGLVGSEMVRLLCEEGFDVITVDNYLRGQIFGGVANTRPNILALKSDFNFEHHELDIRDPEFEHLIRGVDLVVHTAAQPSHPRSIEIPFEDFDINAFGTFRVLEAVRRHAPGAVFIFTSTNKVYGDAPNYFSYHKQGKRFHPDDPGLSGGFDESLRIDRCVHTPFGASKVSADLYVQEYAKTYGIKTGVFRMGCITGGVAMAVEQHNWEPFFVQKAVTGEILTIYGFGGYQVRDVIHAKDLVRLFFEFFKNPRGGEVYNVGGGEMNSISLLEAIDLIEDVVGRPISYVHGPSREGDHIWWVTNMDKVHRHYPNWHVKIGLRKIFEELRASAERIGKRDTLAKVISQ